MNRHKVRILLELTFSILWMWLYIPHFFVYFFHKEVIDKDIDRWKNKLYIDLPTSLILLHKLHNDPYFRTIFYYRIGPIVTYMIGWYRPGAKTFLIPPSLKIGGGIYAPHAYSTILNAKRIGDNFHCIQCTTIGKKNGKYPTIGNNVTLGCNVVIIGDVNIGDNVVVGAGSVVTKDIPSNSIVAGVPAKIIKSI